MTLGKIYVPAWLSYLSIDHEPELCLNSTQLLLIEDANTTITFVNCEEKLGEKQPDYTPKKLLQNLLLAFSQ